ncbi:MAG: hypothetical protein EOP05_00810 [Proteobacteria bacterium]|nr:MAG: hypothetical protein EOP05_00810 [Pseudomonadota bacterium]
MLDNGVRFNKKVLLCELEDMPRDRIFREWVERLNEYYIQLATTADGDGNGFGSLILQLCALDAFASIVESNRSTETKIRSVCERLILRQQDAEHDSGTNRFDHLSDSQIKKISKFMYQQYRCGLVHNGFTLQIGEYARNNEPDHIFLISYTEAKAFNMRAVERKNAFIVNPERFRYLLQAELDAALRTDRSQHETWGRKLLGLLTEEIAIARAV